MFRQQVLPGIQWKAEEGLVGRHRVPGPLM